jgi:hypothetical protein
LLLTRRGWQAEKGVVLPTEVRASHAESLPVVEPLESPRHLYHEHLVGIIAIIYVGLFITGLLVVSRLVTNPFFPAPDTNPHAIVTYFQLNPSPIRSSAFLSFGAAIALATFAASIFGQLRALGIRASWVDILLAAGLVTASDQIGSHLCEWALIWPDIAQDRAPTLAVYYLLDTFGGTGFSIPMGLFVGSISLVAGRWSLLPKWMVWIGFIIAAIGIISWLKLLLPTSPLLPAHHHIDTLSRLHLDQPYWLHAPQSASSYKTTGCMSKTRA